MFSIVRLSPVCSVLEVNYRIFAMPTSEQVTFVASLPSTLVAPFNKARGLCRRRPRRVKVAPSCTSAARPNSKPSDDFASAQANVNTPRPPPPRNSLTWETIDGCEVLVPPGTEPPAAIVRFTGGFFAGAAPRNLYGAFLEEICHRGNVAIIAAPVGASMNHKALAGLVAKMLGDATKTLSARWNVAWLPSFGLGHSLGAKLQVLAACDASSRAVQGPVVANMLLSFNNFSMKESIPMWDDVSTAVGGSDGVKRSARELGKVASFLRDLNLDALLGDEVPTKAMDRAQQVLRKVGDGIDAFSGVVDSVASSDEDSLKPEEVLSVIGARYSVPDNLVLSFSKDDLDQSDVLEKVLKSRFGGTKTVVRRLNGTHVTPLTPRVGREDGDGFNSVGSQKMDEEIRRAASDVNRELDQTVAVIVAYLRLHLEVLSKKSIS